MGKRSNLFKKLLISVAIAVPATAVGVISLVWSVHGPEPLVHVARVLLLPVFIVAALFGDKALGFAIRQPYELRRAIQIAKQNLEDGTLYEVPDPNPPSQVTFLALAKGEPWDDIVYYRFCCNSCGELFSLHAETYHGSGGYWEPENHRAVRANL